MKRRYYLNLSSPTRIIRDEEGTEADLDAVRAEALESARELLAAAIREGRDVLADEIVITDESGHYIDHVSMFAVLPPTIRQQMRSDR